MILNHKNGIELYGQYWLLLELLCGEFKKDTTVFIVSSNQLKTVFRVKFDRKLREICETFRKSSAKVDTKLLDFSELSDNFWKIETPIILELMGKDFKRTRQQSGSAAAKNKNKNKNKEKEEEVYLSPPKAATQNKFTRDVFDAYNQILKEKLPAAKVLNPSRIKKIQAASKNMPGLEKIEGWHIYFEKVLQTPFLTGNNNSAWRADFDWLIITNNAIKVAEGRYDSLGSSKAQTIQNNLLNMENPYE